MIFINITVQLGQCLEVRDVYKRLQDVYKRLQDVYKHHQDVYKHPVMDFRDAGKPYYSLGKHEL